MKRVVLLSGGMDSAAALFWAKEQPGKTRALCFAYGQPHRNAELYAARHIAEQAGVPYDTAWVELKPLDPTAGRDARGLSRAFVPGRNDFFLSHAASVFAEPDEDLRLVIGSNYDDAAGFPDCRPEFFKDKIRSLRAAYAGYCDISVETPWLFAPKAGILRWAQSRPAAMAAVLSSMSCYRGTRCGACDPCALRAGAFAEVGVADGTSLPAFSGGDPAREAAFK